MLAAFRRVSVGEVEGHSPTLPEVARRTAQDGHADRAGILNGRWNLSAEGAVVAFDEVAHDHVLVHDPANSLVHRELVPRGGPDRLPDRVVPLNDPQIAAPELAVDEGVDPGL